MGLALLAFGCGREPGHEQDRPATSIPSPSASATSAATAPSPRARAARVGLDPSGRPQPSDEDRCAMCGMKIVDHRDWAGAIETKSGEVYYFCDPRCTIATTRQSERFLGCAREALGRIRVTEYLRPEQSLDATSAYYVVGSDVRGPMGASLLPAATEADADTLVRRHGGRVVRYDDIDVALLKRLKEQGATPPARAPASGEPNEPAR